MQIHSKTNQIYFREASIRNRNQLRLATAATRRRASSSINFTPDSKVGVAIVGSGSINAGGASPECFRLPVRNHLPPDVLRDAVLSSMRSRGKITKTDQGYRVL